jgi:type IV secretion system protein TrbL
MGDLGIIDQFTNVFSQYIDTGFGLLKGEVGFLTATLIAIDITLAGLFWAMGGGSDDVIARLIKKVLYVGTFAFIITNFNQLSGIVFHSFAGLGLVATGSPLAEGDLLRPGRLAAVGVDAGRPILNRLGQLAGFPDVFLHFDSVVVLFVAWLIVIVSFFVLAVQLFVTLIEFKLTTLAGFVLVPFALWNKTAFLAERVLGNVVSSGIKVLVLAVIVGIGIQLFAQLTTPPPELTIDQALAIMLASLALFGLGLFGPGIATGLVSGGPQLGAGAAAGTALAIGGLAVATGAGAVGAGRAIRALRGGGAGPGVPPSAPTAAPRGGPTGGPGGPSGTDGGPSAPGVPPAEGGPSTPSWIDRLHRRQRVAHGVSSAAQVARTSDHPGGGPHPDLTKESD